jgi:hypothetical protein
MPVDPIMSALPMLANLIATPDRAESAAVRAQVLSLPAQLVGAPSPVSVSGIVAESPIPGQLRIATAIGDVQLQTPTELPPGRAVTIVTRPNVPTEVFLLPSASPGVLPQAKAPPQPGAMFQRAAPSPTGAPPQPALTFPTNPGQAAATPTVPASPAASGLPPPVPAVQNTAAGVAQAANPATPAPIDPRGNPAPAQRAALPPAPPAAPHPPTLSPASLVATFGAAVMPERASAAAYAAPATTAPPPDLLMLLTDLRRLVGARDPKAADRLLRRLPAPDRAGALAALTLPVAAKRAELATWLGRDIVMLVEEDQDDSKTDLVERLTAGLTQTEERLDDSGERTWRWRPLPMLDNGQFVPMQVGVAPERTQPDSGGDGKRRPARIFEFAVEAALSALGLTRVEATYQQRRLDLVVQCETPIEQEGREQIVAGVARVFEEFGLGGSCRFEPYRAAPAPAGPVKV